VGKNVANPTAMLLCAAKMLRHVNLRYYCDMIHNAVNTVLKAGKVGIYHTHDQVTHNLDLIITRHFKYVFKHETVSADLGRVF
jgi:isocitrate/isopropylmalate dehydrogenase